MVQTAQRKSLNDFHPLLSQQQMRKSWTVTLSTGLHLCVGKGQPQHRLHTHVLTCGIMTEVILCGINGRIIYEVIKHNFNIRRPDQVGFVLEMFVKAKAKKKDGVHVWFDEVFDNQSLYHKKQKEKKASVMPSSEWKIVIRKRKLALQEREKKATVPTDKTNVIKSRSTHQNEIDKAALYSIRTKIGLNLDLSNGESRQEEKLDLKLLTTAVVAEIHQYAQKVGNYHSTTLFDILDHNFGLISQHHKRWEFSLTAASKVRAIGPAISKEWRYS